MTAEPGPPRTPPPEGSGPSREFGNLLEGARPRLLRMARLRLDPRLQGRLDPGDVVQDVFLEASRRRKEFDALGGAMPLIVWLRLLGAQRIAELHRQHLGAQARDVRRETRMEGGAGASTSTGAMAEALVATGTGPPSAAARTEMVERLRVALESMEPLDREALLLRHFEQLTAAEAACELGISEEAAGKRYLRALRRIRDLIGAPGREGA